MDRLSRIITGINLRKGSGMYVPVPVFSMSALIINDVPIECINQAAVAYNVPATLIVSVLKTEGGRKGLASRNRDGTYDYGPMQINSRWLKEISYYGYTKHDIQYNPCKNVAVGAWILAQSVAEGKTVWHGVGNYHSHTPSLNEKYHGKVQHYHSWLNGVINKERSVSS